MSYTIKTIKVRPSIDIPWIDITQNDIIPVEPNEIVEQSVDGLTKTNIFTRQEKPMTVQDLPDMILPESELKTIEYFKANGITRRIIITNNATNEVIQDFYDVN